jgi:hypothetical protein
MVYPKLSIRLISIAKPEQESFFTTVTHPAPDFIARSAGARFFNTTASIHLNILLQTFMPPRLP